MSHGFPSLQPVSKVNIAASAVSRFSRCVNRRKKNNITQTMCWLKKLINHSTLADEIVLFFWLRLWGVTYRKKKKKLRHNLLEFVVKSLMIIVELI